MQFLFPIGLLALLAVLIPIIIHLWNIKPSKVLKIGSIAFFGESATQSSKSLKINNWFLLLLRCLLLIIVALILAAPYFIDKSNKKGGWLLFNAENTSEVYKQHKNLIDSLILNNYELRDFNLGFKPIHLRDTASNPSKQNSKLEITSLLQQLNNIVPQGHNVYVIGHKSIVDLNYKLPQINYPLQWVSTYPTDTVKTWITNFDGKTSNANSEPSFTIYKEEPNQNLSTVQIGFYEDQNSNDSKYLKAAIQAISTFSNRPMELANVSNYYSTDSLKALIWLSENEIPNSVINKVAVNGRILKYGKGEVRNESSIATYQGTIFNLHKTIYPNTSYRPLLKNSFGQPILSEERTNKHHIYHLYTRFKSNYTDLIHKEEFVKILLPIVINGNSFNDFGFEDHKDDQRQIANGLKSVLNGYQYLKILEPEHKKNITYQLWFLAFLIFAIERFITYRIKNNGIS